MANSPASGVGLGQHDGLQIIQKAHLLPSLYAPWKGTKENEVIAICMSSIKGFIFRDKNAKV